MRKAKSSARGPAAKRRVAAKSVDEYLAGVPELARSTLNKLQAAIRSAIPPDATEAISYGIPAVKHKGVLLWYAAFSSHCSFFPGASVIKAFKDELKDFQTSKGTIRFPLDKPVPAALVKKMVNARIAEKEGKEPR
jgi:uncharacterized protein YdhG (YjbR/CyaY superfamily)